MEAIELSFKYSKMLMPAKYHSPTIQRSMDLSSVPTTPLSATTFTSSSTSILNGSGGGVSSVSIIGSPLLMSNSIDKSDEDLLCSQRRLVEAVVGAGARAGGTLVFGNDSEIEKHFGE